MDESNDRAFSIGRIFSRAFGVMGRNPLVAFGAAFLLSAIPTALFSYGFTRLRMDMRDTNVMFGVVGSGIIAFLVGLFLRAIVQGCLVRATVADSEGRKASFGECLGVAASRALPLIAVSVLFVIGVVVGMVLLVVPGIMFAVACAVAVPVVVEERVGIIEAFGRASVLTRGARWSIFGLFLLVLILIWLVQAIEGVIAIAVFHQGFDPFSVPLMLTNIVVSTLLVCFSSTIQTALYVELRNWKDGPAATRLNEIFE